MGLTMSNELLYPEDEDDALVQVYLVVVVVLVIVLAVRIFIPRTSSSLAEL